jgi:hypothetical protein
MQRLPVSRIVPGWWRTAVAALALATAASAAIAQTASALPDLLARAGVRGTAATSCRGEFRPGHPNDFAVAMNEIDGQNRYFVVQDDGKRYELDVYADKPDLACYTITEADRLNSSIARSDTINGRITAEWDGHVVCGFIEATIAVCWQFAPEQRRFVRIGGWTT